MEKVEWEVLSEVFDPSTLKALLHLIDKGILSKVYGFISTGKEACVLYAIGNSNEYAVKIYRTFTATFVKGIWKYIEGDPRFQSFKKHRYHIRILWASKEFKNLKKAFKAGVFVPEPILVYKNILVMRFIGEEGAPAPLLKDYKNPDFSIYEKILENIKLLHDRAKLVHSDLSEFNVMVFKGDPYFIDMGQAVPLSHPLAYEFLFRDIKNINYFFKKAGVETYDDHEVYRWVVGE
ncbi:serine protein kinase RIO [archaeon]|nr:MAG: serine protein kinase RIO [archaeon]RLG65706.1 MAG: serine protein kinase RIO [archaeon]HDM23549.1 serine protein kinase RIO [Candidatus Bathyarchaeota archaeon]